MARSAIDVKALLTAFQNVHSHGKRHYIAGIVADLAGIEIGVGIEMAASHSARNQRTRGALVGIKVAACQRLVTGLVVHVLTAACQQSEEGNRDGGREEAGRGSDLNGAPPKRCVD